MPPGSERGGESVSMKKRNLLPWDVFTKTVRKTPEEVYDSLYDRRLLSPEGQAAKSSVLRRIIQLFEAMDASCDGESNTAFAIAERAFVDSGYLNLPSGGNGQLLTSSSWPRHHVSAFELPDAYEIVKFYSPHVARARINHSGKEDGTVVEVLLKKTVDGAEHEIDILEYLKHRWDKTFGDNARPPFPTDVKKLGDGLFEEEFIYSRPLVPTPDEYPEPVFERIRPLLKAVEWLHDQQVIHGDLNIHNILVTASSIRLIDFGNARCPGINENWFRSGTPAYRAPEAFECPPDPRMDIFSLGSTLHLLFFGTLPYDPDYQPRQCRHIRYPRLKAVLDKATQLQAEKRHDSVAELHADLAQTLKPA